jgi:hypothetical protein
MSEMDFKVKGGFQRFYSILGFVIYRFLVGNTTQAIILWNGRNPKVDSYNINPREFFCSLSWLAGDS